MTIHTLMIATVCSLIPLSTSVNLEFFSARDCGLSYGTVMLPSERGCSTLGADGNTLLSVRPTSTIGLGCTVELFLDESCNELALVLDSEVESKCFLSDCCIVSDDNVIWDDQRLLTKYGCRWILS